MKKKAIFLLVISFMLTFLLSACAMKDTDEEHIEMEISLKEGETTDVWGIQLSVRNITSTGMTLICQQSGGKPTGELHTGSYYFLKRKSGEDWVKVEKLEPEDDVAWTDEAWTIPMDDTVAWEIDWEWLYGKLPIGRYRIGKEITDFRETGDYDTRIYYVYFEVES
jgi:Big-like domain-containing protein